MRIRAQLTWMVAAVIAPLALAAGLFVALLLQSQRQLHSERQLERVRALRLAIDTQLAATIRVLCTFTLPGVEGGLAGQQAGRLRSRLAALLAQDPMWSSVSVLSTAGEVLARQQRASAGPVPPLDEVTRKKVLGSRRPAVSGLVQAGDSRRYHTFIAVPELDGQRVERIVVVGIDQRDWLAFLRSYPLAIGSTLTMSDQNGRIIARSLNNERLVGTPTSARFRQASANRFEGTYEGPSLDGVPFHTSFARLEVAPWVLGTGVPLADMQAELHARTLIMIGGLLLAGAVAAVGATVMGRRVIHALDGLEAASRVRADAPDDPAQPALPIDEAEAVRRTLLRTLADLVKARTLAEQAHEQALRANRGKDEFLAMLAHELRNPLSAMSASVALLESAKGTEHSKRHAQDVLKRQVRQMARLVNDLLDAARASTGKLSLRMAEVELAQVVGAVVQAFRHAGRIRHLATHTALQPVRVRGDAMRLEQIVSNLLDNSAKFTPAGGDVRLELSRVDAQAVLTLTDTGAGIEPALLNTLFDPFTQADTGLDRSHGGLGLGLHVVRGLVELHGGSIEAHSEGAGRGARFTVRLPVASEAAAGADEPAPVPQPLPPLHVGLLEDHEDVSVATATLLRTAGHRVRSAFDGHHGLQLLTDEPPDVALIDVGLPGLNGLEVVRRLPTRAPILLALTAYGDDAMRAQVAQAGFDGFLQKPFDLRAFEQAVHEAWRARQARPRPKPQPQPGPEAVIDGAAGDRHPPA